MGLGKVLEKVSPRGSLKRLMEQRLGDYEPVKPLGADDWIRVSAFAEICPRQEVICTTKSIVREKDISPDLELIFAHGHSLHWGLQNKILPRLGCLIGVWMCESCGTSFGSYQPGVPVEQTMVRQPDACSCGHKEFIYKEVTLVNERFRISGHPDGVLVLPGQSSPGLFEAKSVGARNAWQIKSAPMLGHVVQVQLYMWMLGLKWAKILYWDKAGNGLDCITEHHVEYSDDMVATAHSEIEKMRAGLRTGSLPERICATETCTKAKECPVIRECFDMKEGLLYSSQNLVSSTVYDF